MYIRIREDSEQLLKITIYIGCFVEIHTFRERFLCYSHRID